MDIGLDFIHINCRGRMLLCYMYYSYSSHRITDIFHLADNKIKNSKIKTRGAEGINVIICILIFVDNWHTYNT